MNLEDCRTDQKVIINNHAGTKELVGYIAIIRAISENGKFVRVNFIEKPGFQMNDLAKACMTGSGFGFRAESLDIYVPTNREAIQYLKKG